MGGYVRPRTLASTLGTVTAGVAADLTQGAGQITTQVRIITATANAASSVLAGGAGAGLTYIEGTSASSPVVPLPVDAATIADGLWIVQGIGSGATTGDAQVRARLVTSTLNPISAWFYTVPGTEDAVEAKVPAHFAVFGNSDTVRLQFEGIANTGTVTDVSGTITGYLVGSLPT